MLSTTTSMQSMLTMPIDLGFLQMEEDNLDVSLNFSVINKALGGIIEDDDTSEHSTKTSSPRNACISIQESMKNEASESKYVMGNKTKNIKITAFMKKNWSNRLKTCREVLKNKLIAKLKFLGNEKVNSFNLSQKRSKNTASKSNPPSENIKQESRTVSGIYEQAIKHIMQGQLNSTDPCMNQVIKNILIKLGQSFQDTNRRTNSDVMKYLNELNANFSERMPNYALK